MSDFSNRFKELKEEHKLTLKDLSEALDISQPNLSYYMKGREPNYDTLIKIADYFDVTTDWLIGKTDTRNSTQKSLYEEIENRNEYKLSATSKKGYLMCQKTMYNTLDILYTLFTFCQSDPELIDYLSNKINMSAGILFNSVKSFAELTVYDSKDNILNLIKYGELCSDVQQQLLLSTFYSFANRCAKNSMNLPQEEKEYLKEMLDFLFDNYEKRFPVEKTIELFNETNNFSLDKTHTEGYLKILIPDEDDQ